MNFKTLTFRQIFITLTIIMFANLAVNVFQGSTSKSSPEPNTFIDHDGICVCDGLDTYPHNINYADYSQPDYSYDDEMLENMRAYQLDFLDNGDVAVYDGKRLVGVLQYNTTCHLHKLMDRDND